MKEYMTTQQICERLGVHENTALRWLKAGQIPAVKIGGRWFVSASDFENKMKGGLNDHAESTD